jgi:hypothetical protein
VVTPVATSISLPSTELRRANAIQVENFPDIYDLVGENGAVFARASVQQYSLSKTLRAATGNSTAQAVTVEWNTEFSGYMITGLLS